MSDGGARPAERHGGGQREATDEGRATSKTFRRAAAVVAVISGTQVVTALADGDAARALRSVSVIAAVVLVAITSPRARQRTAARLDHAESAARARLASPS